MVVAMLLKSEPIYETLKRRMLEQEAAAGGLLADNDKVPRNDWYRATDWGKKGAGDEAREL